jgi:ABC-type lipoprotein release transport system permease subunit
MVAGVASIALVSSYLPALRAARLHPATVLRSE